MYTIQMLRLLLSLGLLLTNALTIGPVVNNTFSSSPSISSSPSASSTPLSSTSSTPLSSASSTPLPSASSVALPSASSTPLPSASSVPPTDIPRNNNTLGYIMVGCTVGALIIIGTIAGIHAALKRRYKNMSLVTTANTANTENILNKTKQASIRKLLPSQKILKYKDDSDNRIVFPPV